MTKRFDLVDGLVKAGFENTDSDEIGNRIVQTFSKTYSETWNVAWIGEAEHVFTVDVDIRYNFDREPVGVRARYSNGKEKEHGYDKRAFNAIRETVKNNGFEF